MKKTHLTVGLLIVFAITAFAQTPSEPPKTQSASSHSESKSATSYSMSVSDSDNAKENMSVSTSNSDDSYKFRARFSKLKTAKVKAVLLDRLGKTSLKAKGGKYEWIKIKNGDEVFECKLTNGRVRIFVNKEEVSSPFLKEIEALGKELRIVIAGEQSKKHKERELERAQRDLVRAKQNLERAKRKLKGF